MQEEEKYAKVKGESENERTISPQKDDIRIEGADAGVSPRVLTLIFLESWGKNFETKPLLPSVELLRTRVRQLSLNIEFVCEFHRGRGSNSSPGDRWFPKGCFATSPAPAF